MPQTRHQINAHRAAALPAGGSRETPGGHSRLGGKFIVAGPGDESPTVCAPAGARQNDRRKAAARPCS
jgi:hypothetical protein